MKICYDKLWKLLIDKKMKKYQLREQAHISSNSVAKLSKDENVSLDILAKICETLDCDIGDVCSFQKDDEDPVSLRQTRTPILIRCVEKSAFLFYTIV